MITTYTTGTGFTLPNPADVPISTYTQTAYVVTSLPGSGVNSVNLGAIIGGAVGGFAALSATGFGIFFVRRKLKKDKAKQISAASGGPGLDEKDGKGKTTYQHLAQSELPDHSLAEMSHPPQELDGSLIKYETSASSVETRRSLIERRVSL